MKKREQRSRVFDEYVLRCRGDEMTSVERVPELSVFELMAYDECESLLLESRDSEAHCRTRQVRRCGRPPPNFLEHGSKIPTAVQPGDGEAHDKMVRRLE